MHIHNVYSIVSAHVNMFQNIKRLVRCLVFFCFEFCTCPLILYAQTRDGILSNTPHHHHIAHHSHMCGLSHMCASHQQARSSWWVCECVCAKMRFTPRRRFAVQFGMFGFVVWLGLLYGVDGVGVVLFVVVVGPLMGSWEFCSRCRCVRASCSHMLACSRRTRPVRARSPNSSEPLAPH